MDRLPPEILFGILDLVSQQDLVSLQSVSKKFLTLARANRLWREQCYDHSPAVKIKAWTAFRESISTASPSTASPNEAAATFASILQSADASNSRNNAVSPKSGALNKGQMTKRLRAIAEWDPSYESEDVDWYSEYIARAGPLSVSWFAKPHPDNELKGLAYLDSSTRRRAVSPLEDGSVCIWDIDGGQVAQSAPGILFRDGKASEDLFNVVESISVDCTQNKAFVAVGKNLEIVDLETLQVVASQSFGAPITALSQFLPSNDVPLTIGTKNAVYLHDSRTGTLAPESVSFDAVASPRLASGDIYPLSIVSVSPYSTYLAGRHPSILAYDRRNFTQPAHSIHSGARLCSLAYSSSGSTNEPVTSSLLACGEYNGRGSLEVYSLADPRTGLDLKPLPPSKSHQNRQTASRAKLLSVAPHGTRIVFSDSDGGLKWFERDGSSLVRAWNINEYTLTENKKQQTRRPGNRQVLEFGTRGDDAVKKIIPLLPTDESSGTRGIRGDDQLLLWTHEKAGVLKFRHHEEWHDAQEKLDHDGAEEEARRKSDQEKRLDEAMTRALMHQSNEVNFMRRFGWA